MLCCWVSDIILYSVNRLDIFDSSRKYEDRNGREWIMDKQVYEKGRQSTWCISRHVILEWLGVSNSLIKWCLDHKQEIQGFAITVIQFSRQSIVTTLLFRKWLDSLLENRVKQGFSLFHCYSFPILWTKFTFCGHDRYTMYTNKRFIIRHDYCWQLKTQSPHPNTC